MRRNFLVPVRHRLRCWCWHDTRVATHEDIVTDDAGH
jgi:hypothetical protein